MEPLANDFADRWFRDYSSSVGLMPLVDEALPDAPRPVKTAFARAMNMHAEALTRALNWQRETDPIAPSLVTGETRLALDLFNLALSIRYAWADSAPPN